MQLKHATCFLTIICDMCQLEYASTSVYFFHASYHHRRHREQRECSHVLLQFLI